MQLQKVHSKVHESDQLGWFSCFWLRLQSVIVGTSFLPSLAYVKFSLAQYTVSIILNGLLGGLFRPDCLIHAKSRKDNLLVKKKILQLHLVDAAVRFVVKLKDFLGKTS